jgi:type II secretory pathway pseudopilin PulG
LIEVIVVIAILGILAALVVQNLTPLLQRASKARCMANLRNLHTGFSSYLSDQPYWPQMPEEIYESEHDYDAWWIDVLRPYGLNERVWQCPVLRKADATLPKSVKSKIHYIPTHFDANPISPRRWSTQPWLIERANAHGNGALIIFPDGSIREADGL